MELSYNESILLMPLWNTIIYFYFLGANFLKILTVIGARPQFIKASVVSSAAIEKAAGLEEKIIHTGHHFDANMSNLF